MPINAFEHLQIATAINEKIKKESLDDIGKLEQDFVYGEATSKDLLSMISSKQVQKYSFRMTSLASSRPFQSLSAYTS